MSGFFRRGGKGGAPVEMTDELRECIDTVAQAQDAMHAAFGRQMAESLGTGESSPMSIKDVLAELSSLEGQLNDLSREADRVIEEAGLGPLRDAEALTADDLAALKQCVGGLMAQRNMLCERYADLRTMYSSLLRTATYVFDMQLGAAVESGARESLTLLARAHGMLWR